MANSIYQLMAQQNRSMAPVDPAEQEQQAILNFLEAKKSSAPVAPTPEQLDPYAALKRNVPTLQELNPEQDLRNAILSTTAAEKKALRRTMEEQKAGIGDIEGKISQIEQPRSVLQGIDLAPLLAYSDSIAGTKNLGGYAAPQTNEQRMKEGIKLRQALQQQKDQLSQNELDSLRMQLNSKLMMSQLGGDKLTSGQEALDKAYGGKEYFDWDQTDRPIAEANVGTLNNAINVLNSKKGRGLSGKDISAMPEWFKPKAAIQMRDNIRNVVNSMLKATLGAAFTEKEGEKIFNQTYNEALDPEQNARNLERLLGVLQQQYQNKEGAAQYFRKHGSLRGYEPTVKANIEGLLTSGAYLKDGASSGVASNNSGWSDEDEKKLQAYEAMKAKGNK